MHSTDNSFGSSGYRVFGESNFANPKPAPMREKAIAHSRRIGVSLVLYSVQSLGQEVHPVTKTVMDQSAQTLTTVTTVPALAYGSRDSNGLPAGMNSGPRDFDVLNHMP